MQCELPKRQLRNQRKERNIMKITAKIKLKEIPTEKLVAELSRRDNVQMFACDLYCKNYRVTIEDYTGEDREQVATPGNCDVLIIERQRQ